MAASFKWRICSHCCHSPHHSLLAQHWGWESVAISYLSIPLVLLHSVHFPYLCCMLGSGRHLVCVSKVPTSLMVQDHPLGWEKQILDLLLICMISIILMFIFMLYNILNISIQQSWLYLINKLCIYIRGICSEFIFPIRLWERKVWRSLLLITTFVLAVRHCENPFDFLGLDFFHWKMEILILSILKSCFKILTPQQPIKCWAIKAESHPGRSDLAQLAMWWQLLLCECQPGRGIGSFPVGCPVIKPGLLATWSNPCTATRIDFQVY